MLATVKFQLQAWDEPFRPTGAQKGKVLGGGWIDIGPPGDYRSRNIERRWHRRASFSKFRIVALV